VYDERERSHLLRRADVVASWALDTGIALVVLLPTLAIFSHGRRPHSHTAIAELIGAALLSTLPLLVRRRWPVEVLAIILVVAVAAPGPAVFSPPALIAVYTIASRRPWRVAAAGAAASAVAFMIHRPIWGYNLPLLGVISDIALPGLFLALGLYQATRLAYVDQLHDRARRLERERALLAEQAATDERLRIARELHDVVAHNVSLMVVQAQALAATTGDQQARDGAASIADLGRDAMSEMHRTLELMRTGDDNGERVPQPTLADLEGLIEQARRAGASASLSVAGEPRPLPAGVELSAYRIVQEALTNVIKHAGAAHTDVRLRYEPESLELEIVDQGDPQRGTQATGETADTAAPPRSGHGITGMRERVALFGGTLDAGRTESGGYRVSAVLPYGEPT
jgi:signal transduction histidine kinase